ncbi:MAG: PhnD/SsuA/transferrin family substrate-binding protein [Pirellulaceae bacterium]
MNRLPIRSQLLMFAVIGCIAITTSNALAQEETTDESLTLVVMDPLAAPLACDCVQGYAQRKYDRLGAFLQIKLRRPVEVVFGETLQIGMEESGGEADIVIGKHSVVLDGAGKAELNLQPIAQLTGQDDSVHQTGLLVVRQGDPAQSVTDLEGYRIIFGPADCDEKHAAIMDLLRDSQIAIPDEPEIAGACSMAAKQLMELDSDIPAAAVISSYAEPLLEGCGNIQKGDLRVVGETQPVPFVTAFVNSRHPKSVQDSILAALRDVELDADMLTVLETGSGFVQWQEPESTDAVETSDAESGAKKN